MVLGSCHGDYFQISSSLTHIFHFEVFFLLFIYIEKTSFKKIKTNIYKCISNIYKWIIYLLNFDTE